MLEISGAPVRAPTGNCLLPAGLMNQLAESRDVL